MLRRTFRKAIAVVLSTVLVLSGTAICLSSQDVKANTDTVDTFKEEFKNPEGDALPAIRWWVMPGFMNETETKKEVRAMSDAGFGRIELVALVEFQPFGSAAWNSAMQWALEEAIECGVTLDFTLGVGWPIKTPSLTDPDDIRCEQGLYNKSVEFIADDENSIYTNSTFPFPDEDFESDRSYELVAVTANKQNEDGSYSTEDSINITDQIIDLNPEDVTTASISWEAPSSGVWTVFYIYRQGLNDASSTKPVIDHFNADATQSLIDYWESTLMAGDMKALYEENGGSFFGDSLELGNRNKTSAAFWTVDLLDEFENRRGYDLRPFLPAIFIDDYYGYYDGISFTSDVQSDYDFAAAGNKIREDYNKTLTELFSENHVAKLNEWADTHNMTLRYQVYGGVMDIAEASLSADIIETESWGHRDITDMYRTLSGSVHLSGRNLYSTESAAVIGMPWRQTWTGSQKVKEQSTQTYWANDGSNYVYRPEDEGNEDAGLLYHFSRQLVTGVNRIVMHGFSYRSSLMGQWPGDSFMSMGNFPNEWDDKTPMWEHINEMTGYIARTQYVMQQGVADVDLAVCRDYSYEGDQAHKWGLSGLERSGFTYDFVSPELLDLENASVSSTAKGNVIAADGPAYQAIIIDQRLDTKTTSNLIPSTMPVETASKILEYGEEGLPIIIVGRVPDEVPYFYGSDEDFSIANDDLEAIMQSILDLPTTKVVSSQSGVKSALESLGIKPDVDKDIDSSMLSFHRTTDYADFYYLYNSDLNNPISQKIELKGNGRPYYLDPYSGEITPIAQYRVKGDRIIMDVDLRSNESMIIALAQDNLTDVNIADYHVLFTDADQVVYDQNGDLAARVSASDDYTFTFSNGTSTQIRVEDVDQSPKLDNWTMQFTSWTAGSSALETQKTEYDEIELNNFVPWNEIESLGDVAGVAVYNTTFNLSNGWNDGYGAMLNFNRVSDTMKITVNDNEIFPNQLSSTVDIGKYLIKGDNTLSIEVTSNLSNVKTGYTQEYGIIGPVSVSLYKQIPLAVSEPEPTPEPTDPTTEPTTQPTTQPTTTEPTTQPTTEPTTEPTTQPTTQPTTTEPTTQPTTQPTQTVGEDEVVVTVDTDAGVSAVAKADKGAFSEDVAITIKQISKTSTEGKAAIAKLEAKYKNIEDLVLFDISAITAAGGKVQPNADKTVTITMPIPAGFDADRIAVAHIKDDGTIELLEVTVKNGMVSFTTDSFSTFAIMELTEVTVPKTGETADGSTRIYLILFGTLLLIAGGFRFYVYRQQKKKHVDGVDLDVLE